MDDCAKTLDRRCCTFARAATNSRRLPYFVKGTGMNQPSLSQSVSHICTVINITIIIIITAIVITNILNMQRQIKTKLAIQYLFPIFT